MKCRRIRGWLPLFAGDDLAARRVSLVNRHLEECHLIIGIGISETVIHLLNRIQHTHIRKPERTLLFLQLPIAQKELIALQMILQ